MGDNKAVWVGALVSFLCDTLTPLVGFVPFGILLTVATLASPMTSVSLAALIALVPPHNKGAVMGLHESLNNLAQAVGPLFCQWLTGVTYVAPFWLCSLVWLAVLLWVPRLKLKVE